MTGNTITVRKSDLLNVVIESIRIVGLEFQDRNSPLECLLNEMVQPAGYNGIYDFAHAMAIEEEVYGDNQKTT